MASANVVRALLSNLRDAALNAYDTVSGAPLPKPLPVVPPTGPAVPIDCGGLLVVQCASITSAFQGPAEMCAIVMKANLAVTVTRCIPNLDNYGRLAEAQTLTAAGLALGDDLSTLWSGLTSACAANTLWSSFPLMKCGDTVFRDAVPGAGGGIAWWKIPVTATVIGDPVGGLTGDPLLWIDGSTIDWSPGEQIDWES